MWPMVSRRRLRKALTLSVEEATAMSSLGVEGMEGSGNAFYCAPFYNPLSLQGTNIGLKNLISS
jgi:hypothetical protein